MPETANPTYVGLDISKDRLDYTTDEKKTASVSNDPAGHKQLAKWLKSLPNPRVVCEATGGYERLVVAHLLEDGIEVCVVQPGRARSYAYAENQLAKTDRIDAAVLRRYGQSVKLRLATPTDPAVAELRDLIDRRRDLSSRLVEVENRLRLARKTLAKHLEQERRFLTKAKDAIEKEIADYIDHDPTLRQKYRRMQELVGVGPVLAATLLGYVPELGAVADGTVSALVGVAPYARDSGRTSRPRHIRGGRGPARHVLYMAAVSASRSNRILGDFYQRLLAAGKPPMVCLIAVMRKMITVLNRLLADPEFRLAN